MISPTAKGARGKGQRLRASDILLRLMDQDMAVFMAQLVDPSGRPLEVARHHREWSQLIAEHDRLVLLAPRDHSKSTTALASVLWRFFRHGFDSATGRFRTAPNGTYQVLLMSATREQARALVARLRDLIDANSWLFPAVAVASGRPPRRLAASSTRIQLASGAELLSKAYGTAVRGFHPDLLLLDDVLSDRNSGSDVQREATHHYFASTLLPMHPARILIVGTAFHQDDLLHSLRPPRSPTATTQPAGNAKSGFVWRRYAALNASGERALWPGRHSAEELAEIREFNPTIFSREYQNRPRDDASSMFPRDLTQLALDDTITFLPTYHRRPGELVLLGADLAISEAAAADFTAVVVIAYELATGRRRVLYACRRKGLGLNGQLDLFADLCLRYDVDLGIVEQNGFAAWLLEALRDRPETRGRFLGENTGQEKTDFRVGVPGLKMAFLEHRWVMPTGDPESLRFARIWQAELSSFGWKNGRLEGLGEHDDTVMATWYVERAIRYAERVLRQSEEEELVYIEDLIPDWEPVKIGKDF